MDNYQISRDRAQSFFLGFDQNALIQTWDLKHDREHLYVDFLGRTYSICRKTGVVLRTWDGAQAGFDEALSIFDLLCHEGENKYPSGNFAPVNSLKGLARTVGVGVDFHSRTAVRFDRDPEAFVRSCLALGGTEVQMGDIGFRFSVFGGLSVILKFYHADEDFPASVTLLWDDHTLRYIHYETVFYIAGFLMRSIAENL